MEMGFGYVSSDQLIGGPWPDNFPSVTSLDWTTGDPNAKYYAVQMLASTLGAGPKQLYNTTVSSSSVYALGIELADDERILLVISKSDQSIQVRIAEASVGINMTVLEGTGLEPGFHPPVTRRFTTPQNDLNLGPYAVAVLQYT